MCVPAGYETVSTIQTIVTWETAHLKDWGRSQKKKKSTCAEDLKEVGAEQNLTNFT